MRYDWSVIWEYRWALAHGVGMTVLLTVCTMAVAIPGGLLIMLLRQTRLGFIGTAFVEFFRNLPLILVIYWTFYVLPILADIVLPPFTTALLALALCISAYNAETFRAGVNSIRKGQIDAALALGMSWTQLMRIVVL